MVQGTPELLAELAKLEPTRRYGTPLFNALARLLPIVGMEAVCLREGTSGLEVFLKVREVGEVYEGEYHVPGSLICIGETFEAHVLARLIDCEFNRKVKIQGFCGMVNNKKEMRGHAISMVFVCELEGEPSTGKWFPINNLPEKMVDVHRDAVIPMAIEAWKTMVFLPVWEY